MDHDNSLSYLQKPTINPYKSSPYQHTIFIIHFNIILPPTQSGCMSSFRVKFCVYSSSLSLSFSLTHVCYVPLFILSSSILPPINTIITTGEDCKSQISRFSSSLQPPVRSSSPFPCCIQTAVNKRQTITMHFFIFAPSPFVCNCSAIHMV
jgi:hypothetical protein